MIINEERINIIMNEISLTAYTDAAAFNNGRKIPSLPEHSASAGVILFDDSWNSYSTVSAGVAKIVKAWIDAEVEPSWEYPVRVRYERVQQGVYQYYTLKTVKGMTYEPPEA